MRFKTDYDYYANRRKFGVCICDKWLVIKFPIVTQFYPYRDGWKFGCYFDAGWISFDKDNLDIPF